ncbi:MAG: ABC transporter permease [Coriobacteriia bacterium]|nr:ABC transporter permease [Coriobacteriia bacterium]
MPSQSHKPWANFSNNNTGSLRLAKFFGRRDFLMSLVWMLVLLIFATAVPWAMQDVYGSQSTLQAMIPMLQNPAMVALVGPIFDTTYYSVGALTAGMMLLMTATAVAFMNIFFVVRYTRADEEQERAEMIRSLPVGRLAPLNGALIGAFVLNLLVVLVNWAGIMLMNIPSMDSKGALLYGAACGAVGMVFAAVAAVCSQLASTSRGALAYSGAIVGLMYLVRAAGDILRVDHSWGETLSRISPLGLCLRVEAFVSNSWWPLPWLLLTAAVLVAAAYVLNARRDLGAGIIPPTPGPAHASPLLRTNLGLTFTLLRNTLIGWAYVAIALGVSYGSIMNYIADFVKTTPFLQHALTNEQGFTMAESFASLVMVVLAGMLAIVPVMIVLKAWREEEDGRAELVLATATSRSNFFGSYAVIALVCSILMPALGALGLWGAAAVVMTDPFSASFAFKGILIYLPAIWLFLGLAALLTAVVPRIAASVSWTYLGLGFFLGYFGQVFTQIPSWVVKLSPFGLIPNITQAAIPWITLAVMTALAFVMMIAAFVLYRRRDLSS